MTAARLLRRVLYVSARPRLWLIVLALCFAFSAGGAFAQSSDCRHWVTYSSPAFDFHGTQAQACAAWGVQNGQTPTLCALEPINGLRVEYGSGQHTYITDAGAGTCEAEPPPPPASAAAGTFSEVQSLNFMVWAFIFFAWVFGFQAGRTR